MLFRDNILRIRRGPMVRPWALAVPALVLLVCLPLLRPLRHPIDAQMSDGEKSRLATVQAIVEHRTLAIDRSDKHLRDTADRILVGDQRFSDQPPMLAALLAPAYWALSHFGWTIDRNPILVAYLLTLLGVTLPVAAVGGLVYRMGRLFELPRKWRTFLAAVVVFGGGLISYGVVLNAHAPAAALVMASAACLIHVAGSQRMARSLPFLALGGACAALAATIDLPAAAFLFLLVFVIVAFRAPIWLRVGGVTMYAIGALPVIFLHGALTVPITGDLLPPSLHPELVERPSLAIEVPPVELVPEPLDALLNYDADPYADAGPSRWAQAWRSAGRVLAALLGSHGLFSHFPVVILAFFGIGKIMHRHWPTSTKALAVATLVSAGIILLSCALWRADWTKAMFAARWFIVFLPLLLFWSGAWLRKHHHPAKWAMVSVLLAFSVGVSLIGATNPVPRAGFAGYTASAALEDLITPAPVVAGPQGPLAGGG